jgi:hypothetical protein
MIKNSSAVCQQITFNYEMQQNYVILKGSNFGTCQELYVFFLTCNEVKNAKRYFQTKAS